MFFARCLGGDRIIVDVSEGFFAGPGIRRELMDRRKTGPRIVRDDRFGSVAVMRIEIPDCNAFCAVLERVECGDGDVTKITETHCAIARGVMSRRSHQTECAFSGKSSTTGFDSGARRFESKVV